MRHLESLVQRLVSDRLGTTTEAVMGKPMYRWLIDAYPLPRMIRMSDSIFFSEDNDVSANEHIIRYECQCKDFDNDYQKLKMLVYS